MESLRFLIARGHRSVEDGRICTQSGSRRDRDRQVCLRPKSRGNASCRVCAARRRSFSGSGAACCVCCVLDKTIEGGRSVVLRESFQAVHSRTRSYRGMHSIQRLPARPDTEPGGGLPVGFGGLNAHLCQGCYPCRRQHCLVRASLMHAARPLLFHKLISL